MVLVLTLISRTSQTRICCYFNGLFFFIIPFVAMVTVGHCLPHFCRGATTSVIITDGRKLKGRIWGRYVFSCVHIKIHQHPSSGSWLETRVPSVISCPVWCLSFYAYCGEKTVRILCFSVQNMTVPPLPSSPYISYSGFGINGGCFPKFHLLKLRYVLNLCCEHTVFSEGRNLILSFILY